MLIDAHCHLQDTRIYALVDSFIQDAKAVGIDYMVCCGTSEEDWGMVLELKKRYPKEIVASFGLHPWYVQKRSVNWLKKLEDYLQVVPSLIGEIGLDYALDDYDKEAQYTIMLAQLQLAQKYQLPVSIHCRRAWEGLLIVLKETGPLISGGFVHSYSGSAKILQELISFNLAVSFSGAITYPGNKRGKKVLEVVPNERLLIETDSPDLSPAEFAEQLNEPAHLLSIAAAVAKIKKIDLASLSLIIKKNSDQLFGAYR